MNEINIAFIMSDNIIKNAMVEVKKLKINVFLVVLDNVNFIFFSVLFFVHACYGNVTCHHYLIWVMTRDSHPISKR